MDLRLLEVMGFCRFSGLGVVFSSFRRLGLYWLSVLELYKSHGGHSEP